MSLTLLLLSLIPHILAQRCPRKASANVGDGFTIAMEIDCANDTMTLNVQYIDFQSNWFGIVFNDAMIPSDAVVFTTGKATEVQRDPALYAYRLNQRNPSNVIYTPSKNWMRIEQIINNDDGFVDYTYKTPLDNTKFDNSTIEIVFRYAWGNRLDLEYHGNLQRSGIVTFNLETGTVNIDDYNTAKLIHGFLMIFAWNILAFIGIMSSRFRKLIEIYVDKHKRFLCVSSWFTIHRTVQTVVVLIICTSFGLAVYFVSKMRGGHFNNMHMIIGLIVVIITVLQPINAVIRPHPPNQAKGETKTMGRFIWEIFHKFNGYAVWVLALVNIYFGMGLVSLISDYRSYHIIWIMFMFVIFIGFSFWIYMLRDSINNHGDSELSKTKLTVQLKESTKKKQSTCDTYTYKSIENDQI